ncbi:MAG: 4Fe-4S binding protein, partial [Chloroflexi bacterium]|nr:4Fe-4S binding protein [Chloroflexota bacterium]
MKLIEQGPFRAVESSYRDRLYRFLRYPLVPNAFALTMGALLVLLLVVAFAGIAVGSFNNSGPLHLGPFSSAEDENSLFNFIMWVVWLPLLSLSALVVGRLWCGNLCPLRLVSDAARSIGEKITGKGSAASPYLRLGWVLPVSFILITFVVKALPVQTVPRYGALLFLSILAAAVLVGLLMRRGAWCRYFCPIGGWLARIARLSILGLRSNASACASCKTQACLSGSSRAGRCPSFLNPSRLDANRYCLQCWNCVK